MVVQAVVLVFWFLMVMTSAAVVVWSLAKGNRTRAYGLACMMGALLTCVTFGGTT